MSIIRVITSGLSLVVLMVWVIKPQEVIAQAPEPKTVTIRFYSSVTEESVAKLLSIIDSKISQGYGRVVILLSSPGGSVFAGLSAYNYLKGIPAQVITHNFGDVDSIATVIYCAGSKRYAVPEGRFLIHGVTSNFSANSSVEPGELEERLKMLRQDIETIATVIATTTNKPVKDIEQAMVDRVVLNAEDAKKWGLVQEVRSKLYEEGAEVISITDNKPTQGSTLLQTSITDPWPFTIFTQWSAAMTHLQDVSTLPPK